MDINGLDHKKGVILFFFLFLFIVFSGFLSNLLDGLLLNGVFAFEGKDGFFDLISGDFEILDDGSDDDLEHTESNWLLLKFGLPGEAVLLDTKDSLAEVIEIDLGAVGLDFPYDDRFGDGGSLHLLGLIGFGFLLGFSGSGFVLFGLFTEKIIAVISSGLGLLLLDLLGSGGLGSSLCGSSGP